MGQSISVRREASDGVRFGMLRVAVPFSCVCKKCISIPTPDRLVHLEFPFPWGLRDRPSSEGGGRNEKTHFQGCGDEKTHLQGSGDGKTHFQGSGDEKTHFQGSGDGKTLFQALLEATRERNETEFFVAACPPPTSLVTPCDYQYSALVPSRLVSEFRCSVFQTGRNFSLVAYSVTLALLRITIAIHGWPDEGASGWGRQDAM